LDFHRLICLLKWSLGQQEVWTQMYCSCHTAVEPYLRQHPTSWICKTTCNSQLVVQPSEVPWILHNIFKFQFQHIFKHSFL
jgi:hypothetical protein